jgi:hypothetical protein
MRHSSFVVDGELEAVGTMSMFERCTEPARRAIFFARAIALLLSDGEKITSLDLLGGILWEDTSRAGNGRVENMFHLEERFPHYRGGPSKFTALPERKDGPALTDSCKMILAWAEKEAGWMGDYWIDNEHLLLGILRVRECPAAQCLARTGLTLDAARKAVVANKPSRPDYGPVPLSWRIKNRLFRTALLGQTP